MRRVMITVLLLALAAPSCTRQPGPSPEQVGTKSAVELLRRQRGGLTEWQKLMLAIAFTESRFNPDAVGKAGDYGCLQITPVYVEEVNRISGSEYLETAIYLHNKSKAYRKAVLDNLAMIERMEEFRAIIIER